MKIKACIGGDCLPYGVSIMRSALGYERGLPEWYNQEDNTQLWLLENLQRLFPDHKAMMYCSEKIAEEAENNDCFVSSTFTSRDHPNAIVAHALYTDNEESHFVIGHPSAIENMTVTLVIAVEVPGKDVLRV